MAATGSPLDRAIQTAQPLPKCLATAGHPERLVLHGRPALNGGIQKAEEFGQQASGPVDLDLEAAALRLANGCACGAAESVLPDGGEAAGKVKYMALHAMLDAGEVAARLQPVTSRAGPELDLGNHRPATGHVREHSGRLGGGDAPALADRPAHAPFSRP